MKRKWPEDEFEVFRSVSLLAKYLIKSRRTQGIYSDQEAMLKLVKLKKIDKILNPNKEVTKDENET